MDNINFRLSNDRLAKENQSLNVSIQNNLESNKSLIKQLHMEINSLKETNEFLKKNKYSNTFDLTQNRESNNKNINSPEQFQNFKQFNQTNTNITLSNDQEMLDEKIKKLKAKNILGSNNPVIGIYKKPGVNFGKLLNLGHRGGIYFINKNKNPSYVSKEDILNTIDWFY